MPLHSCKTHKEDRQSTRESTEWPRYKFQEHSSMKINGWGRPQPFPGAKFFFPRKIGKHKIFTCENHMRLECIY